MFYFIEITNQDGQIKQHILQPLGDGAMRSFPATDDNPHMVEYLAWVAEGNTAEEWNPEETE